MSFYSLNQVETLSTRANWGVKGSYALVSIWYCIVVVAFSFPMLLLFQGCRNYFCLMFELYSSEASFLLVCTASHSICLLFNFVDDSFCFLWAHLNCAGCCIRLCLCEAALLTRRCSSTQMAISTVVLLKDTGTLPFRYISS